MMSAERPKEPARVAAGLKAAIRNPNVSIEARERALEKLKEMGQDVESIEDPAAHDQGTEGSSRVVGGYKATLSSKSHPYTSQEAKAHAEEVLQAADIHERHPEHSDEEHHTRVLAGYKAALHNPRVSEEAKQHAQDYLKEHGVEV